MEKIKEKKAKECLKVTIEMLDKTIKEMKEKGAYETAITMIEDEKRLLEADVDNSEVRLKEETENKNTLDRAIDLTKGKRAFSEEKSAEFKAYTPIFSNMFILKFKEVPEVIVKSINEDVYSKTLTVVYNETVEFNAFRYFQNYMLKDESDGVMTMESLDRTGVVVRKEEWSGIRVVGVNKERRTYEENGVWTTIVNFKYEKSTNLI